MKYLTNLDLRQNELQNAKIHNVGTEPSNPVTGQIYFNTNNYRYYIYDGSAWIDLTVAKNGVLSGVTLTNVPKVKSDKTKGEGSADVNAFEVLDGANAPLFEVRENGDAIIAGIIEVQGSGTSKFNGNVDIGGKLHVDEGITSDVDVTIGEDLELVGNLRVQGNTFLGDDAENDSTTIRGFTEIITAGTKATGGSEESVFRIRDDSDAKEPLFEVMQNGDTVIAGKLRVSGGISGGDEGGSGTENDGNFTVKGNLNVEGDTVLGNDAGIDTTIIHGTTTVRTNKSIDAGDAAVNAFQVLDKDDAELFSVRQNGDTNVGGNLNVAKDATIQGDFSGDDLTLTGNLVVKGNTTLGDTNDDTITLNTNLNANGMRIENLMGPENANDAVTKGYVDAVKQGLDIKESVRVATTSNVDLTTGGLQTIDGIALAAGDRVLVKNQDVKTENGIYIASVGTWPRAADVDEPEEVSAGLFTFVEEGTSNQDSGWVLSTNGSITIDITDIEFTQFSGAGSFEAGDGLRQSGNTINVIGTEGRITAHENSVDIDENYEGQTSITKVGTITNGEWRGKPVGIPYGGTGANNAKDARQNLSIPGKYAEDIGDGSSTEITIDHELGSQDVTYSIRETSSGESVMTDVTIVDDNSLTVEFATAPTNNQYRIVVMG